MDKHEIESLRHEYSQRELLEEDIADNPFEQFDHWFEEVLNADVPEPNAMTLATASVSGAPSARIVLLKGADASGFRFYTNYKSRKGHELEQNPRSALCFFWPELERQVRIEGRTEKLSREESATYFEGRPRGSRLGAWASFQSAEVESRKALQQQFDDIKKRFKDEEVPLPDFWGGYLLRPDYIEFWQGRPGRLHDRMAYNRVDEEWRVSRLAP
jgi:pyridoxamine 5'-phosphate oxidase